MKTYIHSDGLCIKSDIPITKLIDCSLQMKPNSHGMIKLSCYVEQDHSLVDLERMITNSKLSVTMRKNDDAESSVFSGLIDSFRIAEEAGLLRVHIVAYTGSIALDRVTRSRSFQDVSMTYYDVIDTVISGTPNAIAIHASSLNCSIGIPLFQFAETDWEFIKRLSSHLNLSVFPDAKTSFPHISMGLPLSHEPPICDEIFYEHGIRLKHQKKHPYFQIETTNNMEMGGTAIVRGLSMRICEKIGNLQKGELVFRYLLAPPAFVQTPKYYNKHISGASLLGTVVSTNKETVQIALDIDGNNQGVTYPYEWKPTTGNIMYCMPQVGTTVSLYFPNRDEWSARAVSCVRTQETAQSGFSNPAKRGLHTEHGKLLDIDDDKLGMSAAGGEIILPDDSMVKMSTQKKIHMVAQGNITLQSKRISVQVPFEIQIIQDKPVANYFEAAIIPIGTVVEKFCASTGEMMTMVASGSAITASISLFSQLDILSKNGIRLYGTVYLNTPPYDDAPKEGDIDWGKFWFNVIGAIVVVAYVALAIASCGTSLAVTAAVVGFGVGVAAVANYAIWDLQDGNVSEGIDYMVVAVVSTITAAGVAYLFPVQVLSTALLGNVLFPSAAAQVASTGIATISIAVMENMLISSLLNYENKTQKQIFEDSVTDAGLSIIVGGVLDEAFDVLAARLRHIEFVDQILNTSRRSISRNGLSDLISMDELVDLYNIRNVNQLAREIHNNPSILADWLIEEARRTGTIPTLNIPELAEEMLNQFAEISANTSLDWFERDMHNTYVNWLKTQETEDIEALLSGQ